MSRTSRMLRRRKPRRLRRHLGDPAWAFILERVNERAIQRRPFRIYQGDFPWKDPPRLDERSDAPLIACLKGL